MPVRRWACVIALALGAGTALSACSSAPTRPRHIEVSPIRTLIAPPQVRALASAFAEQIVNGEYDEQWAELAPQAQAMWPSEAARTAMLMAKFGQARIASISVGTAALEAMWTASESPLVHLAHVWSMPLRVTFTTPQSLRPIGVAALFSMTRLEIVMNRPGDTASVLDEGPVAIDAPIILPKRAPRSTIDVPILMYHLVDLIPPRSIEPSNWGWRLEVGLTTLPSAFDAQMAYLSSIHATSISLQHLSDALLYGLPLPPHPVVITFDDGRLSQWINAVPVLRRDDFTAVFFPCTGLLGKKVGPQTYMTAAEVQELAATGFSVEDHTINDDTDFFSASRSTLNKLTERTKTVLENLTGEPVQFIAYTGVWPWPRANEGATQEASMFSTLAGYGYIGGVLDLRIDSAEDSSAMLWQLPRVRIGIWTTLPEFAHWFTGQPT
ncbi:MAG TPA: polysaccharide deacetylase family protein [Candidatus Dormibacteraeota bacterium]